MKHKLYGVDVPCYCPEDDRCVVCEGGLADCSVCGGAESSLPADCPGKRMSDGTIALIAAGELDYKDGEWINLIP
jgi:hypothetical protein